MKIYFYRDLTPFEIDAMLRCRGVKSLKYLVPWSLFWTAHFITKYTSCKWEFDEKGSYLEWKKNRN